MLSRKIQLALSGLAGAVSCLLPLPAQANLGDCGQPITNAFHLVATDARRVLTTAIGSSVCSNVFDACICDVNHSGVINSTDALLVLQKAIGQRVILDCGPNCPPLPTTTSLTATTSTTTSTTSTSTSTTTSAPTTMTSATLTTLFPSTTLEPREGSFFDVTFEVISPFDVPIGALQFSSDYSAAGGTFDGSRFATVCEMTTEMVGSVAAFSDHKRRQKLLAGLASGTGFSAPRDILTCRFINYDGVAPSAADFVTTVTDCRNAETLVALPNCFVLVHRVTTCACGDGAVNCVTETCDDANLADGDGCSSACTVEP